MTEWLNTQQVADVSGRHLKTVQRAADAGELHGHQPRKHCSWRFTREAVDAWLFGRDGSAACGCQQLALARTRRSA